MIKKAWRALLIPALVFFSSLLLVLPVRAGTDGVEYSTHVQNIGWQNYVSDGETAGTVGECLQLEAIKIRLKNPENLSVEYRTHVANEGWQDYVGEDQVSGTEGRNLQLEALSIRLTGVDSPNYNVFYRVHAQDYGWLGWAKNGEDAGTAGYAKRLEAVEITVLPKDAGGPTQDSAPFIQRGEDEPAPTQPDSPDTSSPIHYNTYIAGSGWSGTVGNGVETGSGDIRGIEAVSFGLSDELYKKGGIAYRKCGSSGWTPWLSNDDVAGAPGDPVQAVRIKLTAQLPYLYDIYYRVHVPNIGWSNWGRNGGAAGSEGFGRGISLIQVVLTSKGNAPGPIENAFVQTRWEEPVKGYFNNISSSFGPRNGTHHDGTDFAAPEGTPIYSAKAGTVTIVGQAGGFGNYVAVEHDSGETCYYAHMVRTAATAGTHVDRGQLIGYVGNTGNSLGNHLHFEVFDDNGTLVNGMRYY